MKKTSVYLDSEHAARLKRTAEAEGRSQAEILRDAILMYTSALSQPRRFAMDGVVSVASLSMADLSEEEMLDGGSFVHLPHDAG